MGTWVGCPATQSSDRRDRHQEDAAGTGAGTPVRLADFQCDPFNRRSAGQDIPVGLKGGGCHRSARLEDDSHGGKRAMSLGQALDLTDQILNEPRLMHR